VLVAAPSIGLFPQVQAAAELTGSGVLGPVHSFRAHAYAGTPPWEGYESDPTPFFDAHGGPLRDMAVYPLHALTWIFGPVERVSAFSQRTRDSFVPTSGPYAGKVIPVESDDDWQLLVRTRSGVTGVIQVNFCAREAAAPEFEIQGEQGTVALSLLDVAEPLRVLTADADSWSERPVAHERDAGPDHLLGVQHLVACIRTGEPPRLSAAHAIHVVDVLAAAEESARTGQAVGVASTFPTTSLIKEGSFA
jgi:predicted dehydrogenase